MRKWILSQLKLPERIRFWTQQLSPDIFPSTPLCFRAHSSCYSANKLKVCPEVTTGSRKWRVPWPSPYSHVVRLSCPYIDPTHRCHICPNATVSSALSVNLDKEAAISCTSYLLLHLRHHFDFLYQPRMHSKHSMNGFSKKKYSTY